MRSRTKIFRLTELQLKQLEQYIQKENTNFTDFIHSLIEREVMQDAASVQQHPEEIKTQQALISALKQELSKLEQGNLSEQLQQAFQNNVLIQLQTQLTQALKQLDLNSIVSNLVNTALKPIQSNISSQQADLENALLKISQLKVPDNFYEDLQMQSEQINTLGTTVERLIELINNLVN